MLIFALVELIHDKDMCQNDITSDLLASAHINELSLNLKVFGISTHLQPHGPSRSELIIINCFEDLACARYIWHQYPAKMKERVSGHLNRAPSAIMSMSDMDINRPIQYIIGRIYRVVLLLRWGKDSRQKGQVMRKYVFFVVSPNAILSKQSSCWWCETP